MSKTKTKISTEVKVGDTNTDTNTEITAEITEDTKADIPKEISSTVIREGTAPKLRNTEQLIKYAVVIQNDEPCIQLIANDGNGLFSNEPIPIKAIQECLTGKVTEKPFSSRLFHSLFKQQSNNNAGFIAAVLREESILVTAPKKQYLHQLNIPADTITEHLTK